MFIDFKFLMLRKIKKIKIAQAFSISTSIETHPEIKLHRIE